MDNFSPNTVQQYTNKQGIVFDICENKFGYYALDSKGQRTTGNVASLPELYKKLENR